MKALIFSVEEFSVYDGPGIRTTVFLKGCPLRCRWCHNPEGQRFENEIIKSAGCTGCGACRDGIDACPNRLLRLCAEEYTPDTLIAKLEPNLDILTQSGGGVTFSGGEPLSHAPFLAECLRRLRGRVHTAVQTSGYGDPAAFAEILSLCDYMLFDIKLIHRHKEFTGVDNDGILDNFRTLVKSGKDFVVRTPLIPGVTDTEENLRDIARLLKELGVKRIELLPYNRAAGGKYAAVGRTYEPGFEEDRLVQPHLEIFESYQIEGVVL